MNTTSNANLRPEIWQKELYQDAIDNLFFVKNGLMGKGDNNIVELKDELVKNQGEKVTFGLTVKLQGNGVDGDDELEGNEEAIDSYDQSVSIDQKRFAVRLKGKLDEQKAAYDMRMDAKGKLSTQLQEFIELKVFLALGGVVNASLTNIAGRVVGSKAAWSNTPANIPDADTAAGAGARYLCANASGADSLASTDLLTPALISKLKVKAMLAEPMIRPLKIDGVNHYCLFIHPWQAYDLKRNAEFTQAQREAMPRDSKNPIFTGALGMWDNVLIYEHEYAPFLDISVAGRNFGSSSAGTTYAVDAFRAILCGRQAIAFAQCQTDNGWVEETFDYKNKVGFATGLIGGIQKTVFNSKEYGTVVLDTAATSLL